MSERRLVGIDLGITSAHTVRVLREDSSEVCRRRCWPRLDSLQEIERAAEAQDQRRLEVTIEPTGASWLPVAVYFARRGHTVYRVSSAMAADIRRVLHRHAKSNSIDAEALARLPLILPQKLRPLRLPERPAASLERRVRAIDRLTKQIADHKRRIKDLVHQMLPMTPLQGDLSKADVAVLQRTGAHPQRLRALGKTRLTRLITEASRGHLGAGRAQAWLDAASLSLELYDDHPAAAWEDRAAEVLTEVRLLLAHEAELPAHEAAREQAYREVDPTQLCRSLPGLATVGGPIAAAMIGDIRRFPNQRHLRSFPGIVPRASETGDTDRKGQPMSKAGSDLFRTTLINAAGNARKLDPQLARIYYVQMVERGANDLKARCVVARALLDRLGAVLRRGTPYEYRDIDGTPVTQEEAKALAARWQVPEEVRRRRRSKKQRGKGKASGQTLRGQPSSPPGNAPSWRPSAVEEGPSPSPDRTCTTRRPSPEPILPSNLTHIKTVLPTILEGTNVPT